MVGGLKMILFQKFFLILFYITKLQYKPPGTKKVCLSPPPIYTCIYMAEEEFSSYVDLIDTVRGGG